MPHWKLIGSETRTLHTDADTRDDAIESFRNSYPNARLFSASDGRKIRYVSGICDACNKEVFAGDDVGVECELHSKCIDGAKP